MDGDTPVVDSAATNAETVETPATTTATAVVEPASTPVEPSPAEPTRPDFASLLNDPEARKQLLSDAETRKLLFEDPDIRKEIDHRASSEAGRRAKAELERWQQAENARRERERIEAMDPYDLGVQEKERLAKIKEEEALREKLGPIQGEIHTRVLHETGSDMFGAIQALAKEVGLSEKDLEQLHPLQFNSLPEFTAGSIKTMAQHMAKAMAKDLAKTEAKAMFEEHLAARRETAAVPESLPAAEAGQGDNEFEADYAAGTSGNHGRMIEIMRRNGVPI